MPIGESPAPRSVEQTRYALILKLRASWIRPDVLRVPGLQLHCHAALLRCIDLALTDLGPALVGSVSIASREHDMAAALVRAILHFESGSPQHP